MLIKNYIDGSKDIRLELFEDFGPIKYAEPTGDKTFKGVVLDTETTGLDPDDEVIQLATVEFTFDNHGTILSQDRVKTWYNQPRRKKISELITRLTGITEDMVKGHMLLLDEVGEVLDGARIVVAHNAEFDRNVLERNYPGLATDFVWGCSASDVPWKQYLIGTTKLDYISWSCGFYYLEHRADSDCIALLRVLTNSFPDGTSIFKHLLKTAYSGQTKVLAWRAPFEKKDVLKSRGYYWDGAQKVWHITVSSEHARAEEDFLSQEVYSEGNNFAEFRDISIKGRFLQ